MYTACQMPPDTAQPLPRKLTGSLTLLFVRTCTIRVLCVVQLCLAAERSMEVLWKKKTGMFAAAATKLKYVQKTTYERARSGS